MKSYANSKLDLVYIDDCTVFLFSDEVDRADEDERWIKCPYHVYLELSW